MPVVRVKAFNSGVAYFEHAGKVTGDATVLLKFKPEQINDLLKSLVVTDPSGEVTGISYASQEPLSRALKSFGVDISGEPTLKRYSSDKTISPKVREALTEAIKRRNALAQAEAEQRELQRRISRLQRDQGVVRANVTALSRNPTSASYKRFEKKLLEIQDKIDALQARLEEAQAKVQSLRKGLEDYLVKLTLK